MTQQQTINVSVQLDKRLAERLDELCRVRGCSRSWVLRGLLSELLDPDQSTVFQEWRAWVAAPKV